VRGDHADGRGAVDRPGRAAERHGVRHGSVLPWVAPWPRGLRQVDRAGVG
jgi:hypothetical protein